MEPNSPKAKTNLKTGESELAHEKPALQNVLIKFLITNYQGKKALPDIENVPHEWIIHHKPRETFSMWRKNMKRGRHWSISSQKLRGFITRSPIQDIPEGLDKAPWSL